MTNKSQQMGEYTVLACFMVSWCLKRCQYGRSRVGGPLEMWQRRGTWYSLRILHL